MLKDTKMLMRNRTSKNGRQHNGKKKGKKDKEKQWTIKVTHRTKMVYENPHY